MAISITDIGKLLGVGSTKLGYLCSNQHGKTNKWSKYKPVCYSDINAHTNSNDYKPSGASDNWESVGPIDQNWWRANDGKCGLTPKTYTYIRDFIQAVDSGDTDWDYAAPTGTVESPCRLGDFDGYDKNAKSAISDESIFIKSEYKRLQDGKGIWEFSLMNVLRKYDSVDFDDIYEIGESLGDYYVTAFLTANMDSSTVYACNCGKFSERESETSDGFGGRMVMNAYDTSEECTLSFALMKDDITPYLADNNGNGNLVLTANALSLFSTNIISLPNCFKKGMRINLASENPHEAEDSVTYKIAFYQDSESPWIIKMYYSITNPNESAAYTFKFGSPELYFKGEKVSDLSIDNISVPANKTVTGTVTVSSDRGFTLADCPYLTYVLSYGGISVDRTDGVHVTTTDIV